MPIWEFTILLVVLIWIGVRSRVPPAPKPQIGWKYTVVNIAPYENLEIPLDDIGGWGRELVCIWSPEDLDAKNHVYAIFKQPTSLGVEKG
jgi:hypothetical protein